MPPQCGGVASTYRLADKRGGAEEALAAHGLDADDLGRCDRAHAGGKLAGGQHR